MQNDIDGLPRIVYDADQSLAKRIENQKMIKSNHQDYIAELCVNNSITNEIKKEKDSNKSGNDIIDVKNKSEEGNQR